MQKYELTVVMAEGATAAKKKALEEKLTKFVEAMDGKVGKVNDWGEKPLAYKIGKSLAGTFMVFPLELNSDKVKQVDTKLKAEEGVIRYLLIKS